MSLSKVGKVGEHNLEKANAVKNHVEKINPANQFKGDVISMNRIPPVDNAAQASKVNMHNIDQYM